MTWTRTATSAFLFLLLACDGGTDALPGTGQGSVDDDQDPSSEGDASVSEPGDPMDAGVQHEPDPPLDTSKDSGTGEPPPVTSTGPGDWGPGDYPPNITAEEYLQLTGVPGQADKVRGYKVHVPPSYKPDVPAPVVFAFHASNETAVLFAVNGTGLPAKSDKEGFILVMPNGLQEELFGGTWNAGTCCGKASEQDLDDVSLTRAIFAEVGKHLNVDLTRVYATGLSNGAEMSYRLACEASDIFAAVAVLAGAVCTPELAVEAGNDMTTFVSCNPPNPVPVLHMHGSSDSFVPYESLTKTTAFWAMHNGCGTTSKPAILPASGGDTTCFTYEGCPQGAEVTGCSVDMGGHCWFGDPTCGTGLPVLSEAVVGRNSDTLVATDAMWAFVSRFSRRP
jgi:polyhydroxybutyrate depolymerase